MVVDGLVPIGATIVAAPSKFGKSFFCLELSYAVAKGNKLSGTKDTHEGEVPKVVQTGRLVIDEDGKIKIIA